MRILILALAFLCTATTSQAAVVYNWISTSGSGAYGTSGTMSFVDSAYSSGSFDLEWNAIGSAYHEGPDAPYPYPTTLISLRFTGDGGMSYYGWVAARVYGYTDINLDILPDGLLSGSIFGHDTGSHFRVSGEGTNWVLESYATDAPSTCQSSQNNCGGQTGYWQLVSGPTPASVPEPFSVVLLFTGMLAATALRRRDY